MLLVPGLIIEEDDSRRTVIMEEAPPEAPEEEDEAILTLPPTVLELEAAKKKAAVKKVSVWMTGFCVDGNHEGTRNLSLKGSLQTACRGTYYIQHKEYNCTCPCHAVFREIFELTGVRTTPQVTPVAPPPNFDLIGSAYGPSIPSTSGPTDTPGAGVSPVSGLLGASNDGSAPRLLLPIRVAPEFKPTASGQRARGQLEAEVATVVFGWFGGSVDPAIVDLRTENVRVAIKSQPPASDGAIYAIFKRWEKSGWCVLADKPFRMIHLTEVGVYHLKRYKS